MYSSYNTIFLGKVSISLDNVDSTNNYLLQLLKTAKLVEGTVVTARHQYKGKGQRASTWQSEADKNITISILLYPKMLAAKQQFYLSQAMALGIYHFAKELLGEGVSLKWPNDLYYYNQKLGGMLIENSLSAHYLSSSVVGIGINVNQNSFSEELPNAISLQQITGKHYDIKNLIKKLCYFIEVQYLQLKADNLAQIKKNYLNALYRFQQWAWYRLTADQSLLFAKIIDVNEYGKLILSYQNSFGQETQQAFDIKELAFLA